MNKIFAGNMLRSFKSAIAYNEEIAAAYYGIACIYSLRGKKKLALQFLEKSLQKGFKDMYRLEKDSDMKNIRNDSHWKMLKAKYS